MATWQDFNFQQALQNGTGLQNGYWIDPQYGNQRWEGQGENSQMVPGAPTEYWVTKDLGKGKNGIIGGGGSAQYENAAYDRYSADGQFLGSDQYKDMGTDSFTKAMAYLTAAAGLGGIGATMYGAGAGLGGAGADALGAAGMESGLLPSGVTVGGPMSVGLPVGTALPAMGAMGGVGGALGAAAGGGGTAAAGAAGSLIPGVSNSALLGGATTLLGAASGTGGGSGGSGGGRTLDPRMEAYLYDSANGLMPMTQGLLARQAPIAEQNGQLLGDKARGLLGRGIATNPFLKG